MNRTVHNRRPREERRREDEDEWTGPRMIDCESKNVLENLRLPLIIQIVVVSS